MAMAAGRMFVTNFVCCGSAAVTEQREMTARGVRPLPLPDPAHQSNERSGGVLNRILLPATSPSRRPAGSADEVSFDLVA